MQTIRSFISIPITPGITSAATKIIKALKPVDSGIKWVPLDNLHLTLKFLGEVDNVEVFDVCTAIRSVTSHIEPFELHFTGTGGFPNLDKPRVLYAGIEDPSGLLVKMVGELELKLADLGFKPEPRDYRPHLTLGRARSKGGLVSEELSEAMQQYSDTHLGDMVVDEVNLMASFLDKQGPTYQVMDTIDLA
ncbi:RNA 2',3'-cyclic phosphodiesterase [Rhodopirellula sp. MGV]|uniref:RNA 2',3'-cyclic phosphodiesterase n=1 Tax=Rhodopirellula sp. MGV TaxID=2023130 RepID=UPI000B97A12E|nr:RNA 2',3'-cyclic phosphodiesterase [Rhodopirellula sp. MGV]OYP31010.1 RNA 2',3'-cyclic phosphodiesterase [Rhodopirellula sp. MGV]PNY34643.1 RNA 2',3'-cyclic phosphodiesterase [Rhodopirellula baltica]